ncbi:GAF domain-containing protein [Nocardioides sp. zg-579]|uniref:GAF domain-containing protein n=2 Tax=Nocardioides marmotae TaxID=2663857 RepID=A0A6I3JEP6_9ACTN|nr:GAF domain-containing protein [Gordonia jinghuaiqii]MTB96535.1 GAF domain-containing protein [Nocardioides marmotae]QKE01944.1 GAF domain-containing sensor histidine kinase [Nocardioides marmotae]
MEPSDMPTSRDGSSAFGESTVNDLLREVQGRVDGALDERRRWELLLDAVVSMGADLSLDGLLTRIVEIASNLTGAQFAALGVLEHGSADRLSTFVTYGMDDDQQARLGELPTGPGILDLVIDRSEPLRLRELPSHPDSYGLPAHHPPLRSFLGVPVRTRGGVFGNLYLTEKLGGAEFTAEDERIVVALAAAAGVAIENARLHEDAVQRQRWLAATAEIARLLTGSEPDSHALQVVADRARELADADVCWIVAGHGPDDLDVQAVSGLEVDLDGLSGQLQGWSIARDVVVSGQPVTVADLRGDPRASSTAQASGRRELGPAVMVPMSTTGSGLRGVLALAWCPENATGAALETDLPAAFVEQAALALQISLANRDRRRLTLFEDRDRIGRDLHDLIIQRLFAVGLGLQSASRLAAEPELARRLESAVDDIDATIRDIRRAIFALSTAGEATGDLQSEITRIVERAAGTLKVIPSVQIEGPVRARVPDTVAPHLLAVLAEALSNAARHAAPSAIDVSLVVDGDQVSLTVRDDGRGIPPDVVESGLANMRHRAADLGGTCEISSSPGQGTTIEWRVPLTVPRS